MSGERELRSVIEVHVAPLGYEYDRIAAPVRRYDADELYLLCDPQRRDADYHDRLAPELEAEGVTVRERTVDLEDVYDVLGETTTIADEHERDVVRVNVSSGPKLATVGAALACMATDARGYHVHPEDRPHDVEAAPRTEGMRLAEALPSYPLETPTADQVRIMEFVASKGETTATPKKSDLIDFAEAEELEFLARPEPANDKAKFALLNNRILDPLSANDYVRIESVGRTKQVTLTETGRNALRAFRHKL